jgi:hypothetical protein
MTELSVKVLAFYGPDGIQIPDLPTNIAVEEPLLWKGWKKAVILC